MSDEVIILTDDEMPPYCEGCFNQHSSCGTPCQSCKKAAEYDLMIIRILYKKKGRNQQ